MPRQFRSRACLPLQVAAIDLNRHLYPENFGKSSASVNQLLRLQPARTMGYRCVPWHSTLYAANVAFPIQIKQRVFVQVAAFCDLSGLGR
jgi:hypothetical protein